MIQSLEEEVDKAICNSFRYLYSHQMRGICPKCGKYMLIDGYVCFGCGYDYSEQHFI